MKARTTSSRVIIFAIGVLTVALCLWSYVRYDAYVAENRAELTVAKSTCNVSCSTGTPCEYNDEVALRVVVIVFNRAKSLQKCLESIAAMDTLGEEVAVAIWIDRSKAGRVDKETYEVALSFSQSWTGGRSCVNVQTRHANIGGQWIDTWRPKPGTDEMALILEDDINISPLTYRWLKSVKAKYHQVPNICGYSIQMENVLYGAHKKRRPIRAPKNDTVFFYNMMGTWGFSPAPKSWMDFQDWYHKTRSEGKLKPYVPSIVPTDWYKAFEKAGTQESMWEMWHIYYTYTQRQYCLFSNLLAFSGRKDVLLSTNRQETGLHFSKGSARDDSKHLLRRWNSTFDVLPTNPIYYEYDATSKRIPLA